MRLGAIEALEKPISLELLERTIQTARWAAAHPTTVVGDSVLSAPEIKARAALADGLGDGLADRWAHLVFDVRDWKHDFNTIEKWAHARGISSGSLREICRMLRIAPHDARDLARLYRAVYKAGALGGPVEAWLNVSDERTLQALKQRGSLARSSASEMPSIEAYLDRQTFVDAGNPGVARLRELSLCR